MKRGFLLVHGIWTNQELVPKRACDCFAPRVPPSHKAQWESMLSLLFPSLDPSPCAEVPRCGACTASSSCCYSCPPPHTGPAHAHPILCARPALSLQTAAHLIITGALNSPPHLMDEDAEAQKGSVSCWDLNFGPCGYKAHAALTPFPCTVPLGRHRA